MRNIILVLLLISFQRSAAGDKKFPVSEIPDSLLKNAHAVMRLDEQKFIVNSLTSTVLKRHYVITILNQEGDNMAAFMASYDKLHTVDNIQGVLYDGQGNLVKKLKSKDVQDVSDVDDISLIDDSRVKTHNFYYNSYPYTVEYYCETTFLHTFFFPSWIPVSNENMALQHAIFEANVPQDYELRFSTLNFNNAPQKQVANGRTIFKWNLDNHQAIKVSDIFASWKDQLPGVYLAPSDFQLDGIKGDMRNWKDYGAFQYQLIKGRDELPENIKTKVRELVANAKDEKEKIRILYQFLQKNTRYISIQLGVGGWQPFDAKYVATKGYGDCKALTNYMHSILKEAGIPSFYSLVYAGDNLYARNRVMKDFPSTQFNHVILCVPAGKDSMWLECTSQDLPAGYMSGFTSNRQALIIREDGGYLVPTPKYGLKQNQQIRTISTSLNENGDADLKVLTTYQGMKQDRYASMIKALSTEKVKEYLSRTMSLASYDVRKYNYDVESSMIPVVKESLDIHASSIATMMGKRIFIVPNLINKFPLQMIEDEKRTSDFVFSNAYCDSDLVVINIPKGYQLESTIRNVDIQTSFAKYSIKSAFEGDKVIYQRVFEQYSTRLPASKQKEIIDFYNLVYKTDRSKMVLVKETN